MFGLFKKKHEKRQALKSQAQPRPLSTARQRYVSVSTPQEARRKDDSEDFALSMAVGMATHNPILGYAAGGSMNGGIVGAGLSDSSSSAQPSSSCDSGSSTYDTGSSYDGGSCGGSDSGSW